MILTGESSGLSSEGARSITFQRQERMGLSRTSRSRSCSSPDAEALARPLSTVAPPSSTRWYWLRPRSRFMFQVLHSDGTGEPGVSAENGESCEGAASFGPVRSEEHTSELQSLRHLVCRLLLEKKKD